MSRRESNEPGVLGTWTQVGANLKGLRGDTEGYESVVCDADPSPVTCPWRYRWIW